MGSISLLARRKKLIYICHGPWAGEALDISRQGISNKAINRARRSIQSILVRQSDVVFFLSEYMKRKIETELNIETRNSKKYQLIPPIAEGSGSYVDSVGKHEYRKIRNQIYICRRLVRRTGVYDFLERLATSSCSSAFKIIIAGDGPDRASIEQLIYKHKIKNVKMVGFVDEKMHAINYLTSEYMLLPSLTNEGFGLVIIEAIHNDCIPIVSINAGGGAEWMNSTCKNLVYDGSIQGIIECISYASNHKTEILKRLKEKVRSLTKENAAHVIESVSEVEI
jgi:glycosyltransferase involved in cell wall biosynthesis